MTCKTYKNKFKVSFLFIALFFSFSLLMPSISGFEYNTSTVYYDFDYIGSLTLNDSSINSNNATSNDLNTFATINKLPQFSILTNKDSGYYATFTETITYGDNSLSFWVFPTQTFTSTAFNLFSVGGSNANDRDFGIHGGITTSTINTSLGDIDIYVGEGSNTAGCSASNYYHISANDVITLGEWNHVVYTLNPNTDHQIFINGVNINASVSGSGSLVAGFGQSRGRIGNTVNCNFNTLNTSNAYIDEFNFYEGVELNQTEVDVLYNGGYGYNPYSTALPAQIASINIITAPFSSYTEVDFSDFFVNEQNASVNFDYELASYEAYFGRDVETDDFLILFTDATTMRLYGFTAEVPTMPINLSICNPNGCLNTTVYIAVSGYSYPTQIASVADISITGSDSVTRTVSDYFAGYTRRFLQYTSPDNSTVINVTNGYSDSNSCFTATFIGDTVTITGKNNGCSVSARFIVDNEAVAANGNYFTISVTPTASSGTVLSFWEQVLNIFPDPEDIATGTKLLIVAFFMMMTALLGYLATKDLGSGQVTGFLLAILIIIELLFFTAIGYISMWISIMIFVIALIMGASTGAKILNGSGGD